MPYLTPVNIAGYVFIGVAVALENLLFIFLGKQVASAVRKRMTGGLILALGTHLIYHVFKLGSYHITLSFMEHNDSPWY